MYLVVVVLGVVWIVSCLKIGAWAGVPGVCDLNLAKKSLRDTGATGLTEIGLSGSGIGVTGGLVVVVDVFGVVGLIVVVVVVLLLDLIVEMRMSDVLILALHFRKWIFCDNLFTFRIKIKVNQILT